MRLTSQRYEGQLHVKRALEIAAALVNLVGGVAEKLDF